MLQVIPVPWPNNTDIHQLSPSHVVVKRCSGGCHTTASCVAKTTRTREVSVMMGKCPVGGGKCDKECATLQVQDEVECECGCGKVEKEACEAKKETHVWSRDTCECGCRDQEARRQCGERPGKVWDASSCSCICQGPDSCHTGLEYNHQTCSCQPSLKLSEGAAETSAVVREDRGSQDQSAIYKYLQQNWVEIIIIIVLSTTIVILLVTCIALIRKITHLKTMINSTKSSHVKVTSNLYSPCPISQFESPNMKAERGPPMVSPTPQHQMTQGTKMVIQLMMTNLVYLN